MKKQTLLGAIALTTIAAGAAGAANAQQYTVISNATAGASVTSATTVASEVKLDSATNAKGVIGLAIKPSLSAILPGGNSILTISLTGGHTFGTNLTPGAIVANGLCAPTTTISTGGLATDSSVSFLLSGLGNCTNGLPITAAIPAVLSSASSLGINTTFKTELGTSIDGGSAPYSSGVSPFTAIPVVSFSKAFAVTVTPDTTATAATLFSGFKVLTEAKLGTIGLAATANKLGISGASIVTAADLSDITNASFKFVGSQSATAASLSLVETAGPVTTAVDPVTGVAADASPTAAYTVNAVTGGTVAVPASSYTVATTLTLKTNFTAQSAFGPSALQSITREGTTYLIPWVSSGTLSQTSGNSTVVRISNIGTDASGAVSAELLTSSTGTPASTGLVALSSSITKGGEVVITGASLETAIGSNFGRGDIRLTVEAQPATLITRRFIQNVANGSLTEVSLGRDASGGEPQN